MPFWRDAGRYQELVVDIELINFYRIGDERLIDPIFRPQMRHRRQRVTAADHQNLLIVEYRLKAPCRSLAISPCRASIQTSRSNMELLDAFDNFNIRMRSDPGVDDIHSPNIPTQEHIEELMRKTAERIPAARLMGESGSRSEDSPVG